MATTELPVENERVVRLINAYRGQGNRRAVERIFSMHGRILNHIVRRYSDHSGEPYETLMRVGYVGLIKAVNNYKTGDTGLVKRLRWARSLYAKISEATTKLTGELGRPPLVEEIAEEVNVTPEGIVEVMRLFLNTNVSSLNEPGHNSDGESEPNVAAIKSLQ